MDNKKLKGATLAAAAALTLAIAPISSFAEDAKNGEVPCYGINACKGKSACKTSRNACKGQNSCKGEGYVMKTAQECEELGGSLEEPVEE